jgi:hypothetical protein
LRTPCWIISRGCPLVDPQPIGAVGAGDYEGLFVDGPDFVFLGNGGSIKLGFLNNLLGNYGDSEVDMYVFEIGQIVESTNIALRPLNNDIVTLLINNGIPDADRDGYFEMGTIAGSLMGVDIDAFIPGFVMGELIFDAIEITDVPGGDCSSGTPVADIDAVCALFSIEYDCAGVINGQSIFDDCGVCLFVCLFVCYLILLYSISLVPIAKELQMEWQL